MEKILSNITRFFLIVLILSLIFGIMVGFVCSSGIVTIEVHPQRVKEGIRNGVNNLKNNSNAVIESLQSQDQNVEPNQDVSFEKRKQNSKPYRDDVIHEVQPGETLYDIGNHYGVDWKVLKRINKINDPTRLHPKDKLRVPIIRYRSEEDNLYLSLN